MISNKDMPASPIIIKHNKDALNQAKAAGVKLEEQTEYRGLTKREHFAILMQAAFAANSNMVDFTGKEIQKLSIESADDLLDALESDNES